MVPGPHTNPSHLILHNYGHWPSSKNFSTFSNEIGAMALHPALLNFSTQLGALAFLPTILTLFYTIRHPGPRSNISHIFLYNKGTWPSCQHFLPFSSKLDALTLLSNLVPFSTQLGALDLIPTILNIFYTIRCPGTSPNTFQIFLHNYGPWPSSQNFSTFSTQLGALDFVPSFLKFFYTIRNPFLPSNTSHLFLQKEGPWPSSQ